MWLIYAISAAMLWGLTYSLDEKVLQNKVSPYTLLLAQAVFTIIAYVAVIWPSNVKTDFSIILKNRNIAFLLTAAACCTVIANVLIYYSIKEKNATIAGIIELAYPLFTIFFSYVLFKQVHLNWGVITGGILIFLGVILISITN